MIAIKYITSIIVIPYTLIRRISIVDIMANKTPIQSGNSNRIFKATAVPRTS